MENIIQPEILNDEFYATLKNYASRNDLHTFLEIGSSSGGGSTDAFVKSIKARHDTSKVNLFCMEISRSRFKVLVNFYASEEFVRCYNLSSIEEKEMPSDDEVINFYNSTQTALNNYSIKTVLNWLHEDIKYIIQSGSDVNGIQLIKKANHIQNFDMVLIDGSEFSGERELRDTIGAKIIALDDVNSFKCWNAYQILMHTTNYKLKEHNFLLRNGYALFERIY